MKNILSILGILSYTALSYGQIGIHTNVQNATLDVRENKSLTPTLAQGVSFPNFTTEERATFTGVKKGTMIYNTTKHCIELYTVKNNLLGWYCMCDTCEIAEITDDDAVVLAIKGIRRGVGMAIEGVIDGVDNTTFFIDEGCEGYQPAYHKLTTGVSTPIVYDASSVGKRIEKRYTKEFVSYYLDKDKNSPTFGQPTARVLDRKNITLVIPAGDFEQGTDKQIEAYIEIDGNGEFIYATDVISNKSINWDIEIGGLQTNIVLNLNEEEYWQNCE